MTGGFFIRARPRGLPDLAFLGAAVALVIFGLVMLASASSDLAQKEYGDSYYILIHQLTNGLLVGIAGFLVGTFVYYRTWEKFSIPILAIGIIALLLIFTPLMVAQKGGERWVSLGFFTFQPGELIKLALIVYLASWLARTPLRAKNFVEGFLPFLVLLGAVVTLLLMQPATSTAIIVTVGALVLYFMGGARFRFFALAALAVVIAFSVLFLTADQNDYRMQRIKTFIGQTEDPLDSGYHISQAKLAIGSGGLTGVGFGQSTTKLYYLPEPLGDSIFAIVGEEFGFVGSILLLAFFTVFVVRGFAIAKKAPDPFGRLVTIGFVSIIGFQTFVNVAAISGLIPLTGVPLPFISYGGTALAVVLTMTGIIVNISRHTR
ncbi:MAG: putative peptidoglycan glycosyltransferase FtsW [Candidatus Brennerbacteria bacterium]